MRPLAAFLSALFASFALDAAAAPVVVRLGAERIVLDAPAGFSDSLGLASPRLQELAEAQTSASNRILLFAITDGDLRRFMGGDRPEFRRYMIAVIPARLERERLSAAEFGALAGESLRDMGTPPGGTNLVALLEPPPHGRPRLLAELRREPLVVSVLQGMRLPAKGDDDRARPQYILSTTTLLLLRGKALTVSVYSGHDGPDDLDWIRTMTLRWVDELLQLNRRSP